MIFCFEGRKRVYSMTVLSIGISSKLNIISYKTLKMYIKKRFVKKKKNKDSLKFKITERLFTLNSLGNQKRSQVSQYLILVIENASCISVV